MARRVRPVFLCNPFLRLSLQSTIWHDLAVALCLLFVLEGLMPFLYPARWRNLVERMAEVDDQSLRLIGLLSMVFGVGLLYWVNG